MNTAIPSIIISALFLVMTCTHAATTDETQYNRIAFSEQAETAVENDVLVAVMFAQKEGQYADELAEEINQTMHDALALMKNTPDIKAQTLSYRTNPIYDQQRIQGWRVYQAIQLESKNSQQLGQKISELQAQLQVQSISYKVSKEQQRRHMDGLIAVALKRFQTRAHQIAQALGKKHYKLVKISLNTGNTAPTHRVMRSHLMAADARSSSPPAASLQAGTQRLTVTVNGEIELVEP